MIVVWCWWQRRPRRWSWWLWPWCWPPTPTVPRAPPCAPGPGRRPWFRARRRPVRVRPPRPPPARSFPGPSPPSCRVRPRSRSPPPARRRPPPRPPPARPPRPVRSTAARPTWPRAGPPRSCHHPRSSSASSRPSRQVRRPSTGSGRRPTAQGGHIEITTYEVIGVRQVRRTVDATGAQPPGGVTVSVCSGLASGPDGQLAASGCAPT